MSDFFREFSYHGSSGDTKCIVRENLMGFLCGYASVDQSSPLYGADYDSVELNPNVVHGGLTFSGTMQGYDGLWWFGFDCAHAFDAPYDVERYDSLFKGSEGGAMTFFKSGETWTPEKVEAETMLLAYLLETAKVREDEFE